MKRSAKTHPGLWIFLTLLLVAVLPLTACNPAAKPIRFGSDSGAGVAQAAPPQAAPAVPVAPHSVQVAPVEIGDIAVVYSYSGDIEATDSVNVMPMAAGRIESVLVKVGDEVQAGDPIAMVESTVYEAQLKQAQAGLELARLGLAKMEAGTRPEQIATAQAAVQFARNALSDIIYITDAERTAAVAAMAQTEAMLRLAQAEYDKIAWAGQVGMMPQALQLEQATIAYEAAQAAYELQTNPSDVQLSPLMMQLGQAELALAMAKKPFTETDFEMARAQIKLAEAAVDLASVQVNEATIRAPMAGIVAELYIAAGSMAGPQAPVALLVSRQVEAVINIEESRISQVAEGQNAALRVAAYPDQDFPAVVTSVAPIADQDSHTFVVKVTPQDDDHLLRSGMYADLSLLVEQKQATLLVPRAALIDTNDQPTVYVVAEDNTVGLRAVTTGLIEGDRVEILSGLSADQLVVIAGHSGLVDGSSVEVMNSLN